MEKALRICGGSLVLEDGIREGADLLIAGGVIRALGDLPATRARVVDAGGLLIAPGFVDLHVHGAGGALFEQGSVEANRDIAARLARWGTTGALATLSALPPDALRQAVAAIGESCADGHTGLLGIHLEGPFLNPLRCGAQNPAWMRAPSLPELDDLQAVSGGRIRMVTVAPELPGAEAFIRGASERGVVIAIGHTEANEDELGRAIAAGATSVTHLFNAMPPLHHRSPGPVGVALTEPELSVELICDGHHVSERAVRLAVRCKGLERIMLVTDGVAAGVVDGEHHFLGAPCVVGGGVVRSRNGVLAGSVLTLDQALRNVRRWLPGVPLHELLRCASSIPLRVSGLAARRAIRPGQPADLVVLSKQLAVVATLRAGRCVWREAGSLLCLDDGDEPTPA